MKPFDCSDMKALLSAYLDDQLDAGARHMAERHVGECSACRAFVDDAERADLLLATSAAERMAAMSALSPEFMGAVLSRTVFSVPSRGGVLRRLTHSAGWLAAAASLGLAAFVWMSPFRSQPLSLVSSDELAGAMAAAAPTDRAAARDAERSATFARGHAVASALHVSQTFDGALPAEAFTPILSGVQRSATADAGASPSGSAPTGAAHARVTLEDADTLYAAALVLDLVAESAADTFEDIERARRIVAADELVPRLQQTGRRLDPASARTVFAAERVLRQIDRGPLDLGDVTSLREMIAHTGLSGEMLELSAAGDA
jgi:hypothetical protein